MPRCLVTFFNSMLDSSNEIIIDLKSVELGIVPVGAPKTGEQIEKYLSSLTAEQSSQARRKFRKLFRKALKWRLSILKRETIDRVRGTSFGATFSRRQKKYQIEHLIEKGRSELVRSLGEPGKRPTPAQARARRLLVRHYLFSNNCINFYK